jgi:hypothetical protein
MNVQKTTMLSFLSALSLLVAAPWNAARATDWYEARRCLSSEMCAPSDCDNKTSPADLSQEMWAYHSHIEDEGGGRVDVVYDTIFGAGAGSTTYFHSIEGCRTFVSEGARLNQERQQELEKYR